MSEYGSSVDPAAVPLMPESSAGSNDTTSARRGSQRPLAGNGDPGDGGTYGEDIRGPSASWEPTKLGASASGGASSRTVRIHDDRSSFGPRLVKTTPMPLVRRKNPRGMSVRSDTFSFPGLTVSHTAATWCAIAAQMLGVKLVEVPHWSVGVVYLLGILFFYAAGLFLNVSGTYLNAEHSFNEFLVYSTWLLLIVFQFSVPVATFRYLRKPNFGKLCNEMPKRLQRTVVTRIICVAVFVVAVELIHVLYWVPRYGAALPACTNTFGALCEQLEIAWGFGTGIIFGSPVFSLMIVITAVDSLVVRIDAYKERLTVFRFSSVPAAISQHLKLRKAIMREARELNIVVIPALFLLCLDFVAVVASCAVMFAHPLPQHASLESATLYYQLAVNFYLAFLLVALFYTVARVSARFERLVQIANDSMVERVSAGTAPGHRLVAYLVTSRAGFPVGPFIIRQNAAYIAAFLTVVAAVLRAGAGID